MRASTKLAVSPVMMPDASSSTAVRGKSTNATPGWFAAIASATVTESTSLARTGTPPSPITGAVIATAPQRNSTTMNAPSAGSVIVGGVMAVVRR
jgi:hypothetical protein